MDRELLSQLLPEFDTGKLGFEEDAYDALRQNTRTGRPLGDERFVERLETISGRSLKPHPPGPRPRKHWRGPDCPRLN